MYDNIPAQSEATLKIRVSGEAKKSFEVPINKADSRFFKFVFRGDETGEEQVSSDVILLEKANFRCRALFQQSLWRMEPSL